MLWQCKKPNIEHEIYDDHSVFGKVKKHYRDDWSTPRKAYTEDEDLRYHQGSFWEEKSNKKFVQILSVGDTCVYHTDGHTPIEQFEKYYSFIDIRPC